VMAPGMLLAFAGACTLLFLKPGPAMSVIVANSVGYGVRGGLISVAGNVTGFILLLTIVGFGLSWIATAMQAWFEWIRLGGAIYLTWLGVSRLRNAGRTASYGENPTGELFRDGFIVAVANPEVLLFLAAFLPPFVDPRFPAAPQIFALAAVFVLISAIAGALLAVLAGQARQFLSGGRLKHIDYLSGGLLILAGLWLAWPSLEMIL
jgi:homoserine/homoserine lactone efflux protein